MPPKSTEINLIRRSFGTGRVCYKLLARSQSLTLPSPQSRVQKLGGTMCEAELLIHVHCDLPKAPCHVVMTRVRVTLADEQKPVPTGDAPFAILEGNKMETQKRRRRRTKTKKVVCGWLLATCQKSKASTISPGLLFSRPKDWPFAVLMALRR